MDKHIGLALGGGSVLGAAHIGVLRALEEFDYTITHLSGTSIGAFVGALVASGKDWREIEEIALNLSWFKVARLRLSKLGLMSNERLGESVRDMIGDASFADLAIPLYIVAADISNGDKVVLSSGSVADAVMASTCIPGIFEPVELDGKLLVDGGVCDNVPIAVLDDAGVSPIIGVDLMIRHAQRRPGSMIEVLMNSFAFTISGTMKLVSEEKHITLISPELSEFNSVEIKQIPDLIKQGYHQAVEVLKGLE